MAPDAQPLVPVMKLIVGLGNPGPQYAMTRHNAGFMVLDALARRHAANQPVKARFQAATLDATIGGEKCLLIKPTTFMNLSGQSVADAVRFFKVDFTKDLLVVVDEVYVATGRLRLKPGGGAGGHNGLASIQQLLGADTFPRLRVGVGVQPGGGKPAYIDQADYVLGRFFDEEKPLLEGSVKRAADAAEVFAAKGLDAAMNFANAPADAPPRKAREPREQGPAPPA
ncbi:MAG TPA: aminoacyl-tRNA hydrolase [Phycisphaerales bacterium]|nr:aminoacyl-tRNA hydrolase [Phycisphaerales bacterium]